MIMNLIKRILFKFQKQKYSIGVGTYGISYDTIKSFRSDDHIAIGNYCSIASDVVFLLSGEHNYKHISTYPFFDTGDNSADKYKDTFTKGNVIVGNDVWIGHGVTVLSGVKIGDGAVIGAGAIVSKDIPPYAIAVGNPLKIIKYRFTTDQINDLLQIKWWNWDRDTIEKRKEDFYKDIDFFINKYKI